MLDAIICQPPRELPNGRDTADAWGYSSMIQITTEKVARLQLASSRTVTVHRLEGSANVLRKGQTLTAEDVLPGFCVQIQVIFEA